MTIFQDARPVVSTQRHLVHREAEMNEQKARQPIWNSYRIISNAVNRGEHFKMAFSTLDFKKQHGVA